MKSTDSLHRYCTTAAPYNIGLVGRYTQSTTGCQYNRGSSSLRRSLLVRVEWCGSGRESKSAPKMQYDDIGTYFEYDGKHHTRVFCAREKRKRPNYSAQQAAYV